MDVKELMIGDWVYEGISSQIKIKHRLHSNRNKLIRDTCIKLL